MKNVEKNTDQTPLKIFASRQQVTAALERAAARARLIAAQTGTQLVTVPSSGDEPERAPSNASKPV